MSSVNLLASLVKIESLTYNELAELDAQDDMHAVPDQATVADREWAARAFAADADGDDWGPDDVVELGPDPEMSDADWDRLCEERWGTTTPVF
jgi:hypothetical protein